MGFFTSSGILNRKGFFGTRPFSPADISGLQLWVDAGISDSYSGSGSSWNDLSGNGKNATLVNSPSFISDNQGSFSFNGTSQYATVGGSFSLTSATFIIVLKINGTQNAYDGLLFSRGTGNTTGFHISQNSQRIAYTWNDASNTYDWNGGPFYVTSEWVMCSVSISPLSAVARIFRSSGTTEATNSVSHSSTSFSSLHIARDPFSSRYFTGNISAALVYSNSMSLNDLNNVFNYFKPRYNL